MLDSLKFVQGAVAKKDFVPTLVHFRIENGTIRGYNGMMGICSPIDLDLTVSPRATQFVKAIQTCKDTISIHMTPAGKLSVKSGKFKVLVECINETYPEIQPEGELIRLDGELIKSLKILFPFIAEDASRPWARGILLKNQSAFATNNVILLEYWLGYNFPVEVNIPKIAVAELIRIGEEPESLQITTNSVTFHFSGNRWLRTQTYSTEWPDLSKILDQKSKQVPVPSTLIEALEDISPFTNKMEQIFFKPEGVICTLLDAGEDGASIQIPELTFDGCYNHKQLKLLTEVADSVDFSSYPKPCLFYGDRIRGAIIGMRA